MYAPPATRMCYDSGDCVVTLGDDENGVVSREAFEQTDVGDESLLYLFSSMFSVLHFLEEKCSSTLYKTKGLETGHR